MQQVQESIDRSCSERVVFDKPETQLDKMYKLVESWRNHPISVVFGNLGRQPFLLHYYLDLCFGPNEKIKIFCKYKDYSSPYKSKNGKNTDFLIHIEPYFGYTVYKHPSVKHLVILTSHLSLNCWGRIKFDYLQLSDTLMSQSPNPKLHRCTYFKPPIFHTRIDYDLPERILLNASESKSAFEAYLRLLTGREIIRKRPFQIHLLKDDRVKVRTNLLITQDNWSTWFVNSVNGGNYPKDCYPYSYLGII